MNESRAEALRDQADDARKRARESGIRNPLVDAWIASQLAPLCASPSGSFACVLSAGHGGGCFMRSASI